MTPVITGVWLSAPTGRPLLILGPSLGTSAVALWGSCAASLADAFDVLGWELPGHGGSPVPAEEFTMAELAAGVLGMIDDLPGDPGRRFAYAGDSVGGAVGLQLLLDAPGRVPSAVLLCTGARIGDPAAWSERARQVAESGTTTMLQGSRLRWFAPGFDDREPGVAASLLRALEETDDTGYVQVCNALASFDVRDRLGAIDVPVLAVAGRADMVTTVDDLRFVAEGVSGGRLAVLEEVGHLAPAEAPRRVAALIRDHVLGAGRYAAGLAVRREVLGAAHVDRALDSATDLTRDFQAFITDYAWGGIWTRPGLDRRSRSLVTLTALVARGHHEELALHVRAALTNGLTQDEIKECLLQTAIYCGVPDANTAFRIAQRVITDIENEETS